MKYLSRLMKVLTDRMPRKVALASIVMSITVILFAGLFFSLGFAHDDAADQNESLKKTLDQTTRNAKQSRDDRQFIVDNQTKYEDLLHGDRLVPHTRRVATSQITTLAVQRGLTTVGYTFTAAGTATGGPAPAQGGYRVKVEKVDLKIGAPLDTQLFDFLADLGDSFPGSAVVEQFALERSAEITTEALNQVSRGRESGLVHGEIQFTWRIAEAEEQDKKAAAPAPRGAR